MQVEKIIDTIRAGAVVEDSRFTHLEKAGEYALERLGELGVWHRLDQIGRLTPAARCATTSLKAAEKLNKLAVTAEIGPIISPRVTAYVGLMFKAGQGIDNEVTNEYNLGSCDPYSLGLYKYPSYAPERTVSTSSVLRLALLLNELGFPWYAKAVLHGPHARFFEGAELSTVFAALTNANLALDHHDEWRSYLHPAVNLLAIEPYAQRTDELPPTEAKDWVDRARMIAINTTLQHVLRMYAGIEFTDEIYVLDEDERRQRWDATRETFKHLGLHFPSEEERASQSKNHTLLKRWMKKYKIINRLKKKQGTSQYLLYDHSLMVSELMRHLAREINRRSIRFNGKKLLNEDYLRDLGLVHDASKALDDEEFGRVRQLARYEREFTNTYPPEVVARGNVSLAISHDAQLYAMIREYEDSLADEDELGRSISIANDLLSGPYHLNSLTSALLSYCDMAVTTDGALGRAEFKPDITGRFLDTTLRYISDPNIAVVGYAKLMTAAATLSWYLGIPLPKEGSCEILEADLEVLAPIQATSPERARRNLQRINQVFRIFGINTPPQLRSIGDPRSTLQAESMDEPDV